MIVIGLLITAAAVIAGAVLITQNTGQVDLHALGGTWSVPVYGVLVAGMVILLMALLGLGVARAASAHALRLRRERRGRVPALV